MRRRINEFISALTVEQLMIARLIMSLTAFAAIIIWLIGALKMDNIYFAIAWVLLLCVYFVQDRLNEFLITGAQAHEDIVLTMAENTSEFHDKVDAAITGLDDIRRTAERLDMSPKDRAGLLYEIQKIQDNINSKEKNEE